MHFHEPPHWVVGYSYQIITAGTKHKQHFFHTEAYLNFLTQKLIGVFLEFGFEIHAYAVFSNHYHIIVKCPSNPQLAKAINKVHHNSAKFINLAEAKPGRKIWSNYWDREIKDTRDYLTSMHYVMWNPKHHDLVPHPSYYMWCSTASFERSARPAEWKIIQNMKANPHPLDPEPIKVKTNENEV